MSALPQQQRPPTAKPSAAGAVLRVRGVEKSFHRGIWPLRRKIEVLRGATLDVKAGELVGLVGENGSGKSTLIQVVVGLLGSDGGEVRRPERLGYWRPLDERRRVWWPRRIPPELLTRPLLRVKIGTRLVPVGSFSKWAES